MLFTDLSSQNVLCRLFQRLVFELLRGGKHIGMSDGTRRLTIPRHKRINPYTLKGIIKDAGLTEEQFKELV